MAETGLPGDLGMLVAGQESWPVLSEETMQTLPPVLGRFRAHPAPEFLCWPSPAQGGQGGKQSCPQSPQHPQTQGRLALVLPTPQHILGTWGWQLTGVG